MPFALVCYPDYNTQQTVRDLWGRLDRAGVPSVGSIPGYEPHVSLAVFEAYESNLMEQIEGHVQSFVDLPITLGYLGFFLTDEAPAFLGLVTTQPLLDAHRRLFTAMDGLVAGARPYYEPDALVPHCTLAIGVTDPEAVHCQMPPGELPIAGTIESVNLIDTATGKAIHSVSSAPDRR